LMSSLFASLGASTGALAAFERVLDVTQNNVSNASTPGYAAQLATLQAQSFDPNHGLPGGVASVEITSTRDQYADQSVRGQVTSLGYAQQQTTSLTGIQSNFDISGQSGIPGALSGLLQSFSALSISPNDPASRNSILANAQKVVDAFHQTDAALSQASAATDQQLRSTAGQINNLAGKLQEYNVERKRNSSPDAGLDAKVQSTLENLSQLADISTTVAADGTTTVLLGGQTPLVVGSNSYSVQVGLTPPGGPPPLYPGGTPAMQLQDQNGQDITSQVTHGTLGSLLHTRNVTLAGLRGDGTQPGTLNRLAKGFADRVNAILTSGQIAGNPDPRAGVALFTYDATDDTAAGRSLAVNPAITAQTIAAIDPGPPSSSNGIAVRLAALAQPSAAADKIDNVSFTEFYGAIAGGVGQKLSDARDQNDLQTNLVAQARSLRSQISGVSLDREAVRLVEFQKAYQATAHMVTILNELTQATVDMIK
ncbi:MAG: flagellar hook-associated protein FlgK, partial [Acidobacteriota bacterium]|nr:flagellar hook-associated protein FlgK [Acidobacteriota bacterium]